MRLSQFISGNMERILAEWESFAATLLPAAQGLSPLELRDHAQQILDAIARDLSAPQTRQAQLDKSRGLTHVSELAPETAAQTHAVLRARHGFNINHHSTIFEMNVESYRRRTASDKQNSRRRQSSSDNQQQGATTMTG